LETPALVAGVSRFDRSRGAATAAYEKRADGFVDAFELG